MAQQLVTESGTAVLPGAYPEVKVQKNNSNLAATGVLVLVGEADAGPDYTLESDLTQAFYTPDDVAAVLAKYKSGNLVEAFRAAVAPANDPDIQGAPNAIYVLKTNASSKASAALSRAGFSNYGLLADKSYGDLGNLINASVTAAATEVAPTTGSFTYIPTPSGSTLAVRVNGGAKQTLSVTAKTAPSSFVGSIASGSATGLNSLTGVLATGGTNRNVLTGLAGSTTLAVAATGNNIVITLAVAAAWNASPSVGDTLIIPANTEYGAGANSCIVGAASANAGAYVVTGVTSTTISATKLRNNAGGALTAPVNVSATVLASGNTDVLCYNPVTVTNVTGADRGVLTGLTGQTVTGSASGSTLTLALATGQVWAALPKSGDLAFISSTAPSAWHASGANGGWYRVTSATSGTAAGASTIVLSRLSNGNPGSFTATAIAATTDLQVLRPAIDGLGKALELYDGGGTDNVSTLAYALSSTPVTFLSTASTPYLLTSATEYQATLTVNRASDGVSEPITAGGDVVLKLGYNGTSATVTVGATTLTTTVTGGNGSNLSINLSKFSTLADLASYINAQTGYVCSVSSTLYGQLPVVVKGACVLDNGTFNICSDLGAAPCRLKKDAYAFFLELSRSSTLVQLGTTAAQAAAGLPEVQGTFYLGGGAKGGTSAAAALAAITACEKLRANSIIPLFSRDATADIAEGLTDSTSTYQIDAINAAVKSHVLTMSSFKRRRNRQGFVSKKDSFANVKLAANNIASYRVSMTFQDFKLLGANGTVQQFQPWMGATLAAAMQAAGFYRSILFKGINCSGVLMADGSFSDSYDPHLEDAIKNGLLVAQRVETGGFRWNSDQTTYAADSNFVYNSIQAIYAADVVALTTAQRMERAFVGQSLADVSASVALSYLKGIMADLKRLKLLAGDDEAPLGFSQAKIQISGNTMKVTLTIKLATTIVFIPISFLVTQVQSTAQ
jgi:hypothetical protein